MIKSFKDSDAGALYRGEKVPRRLRGIARGARLKLRMIDAASTLDDLRSPPGNKLKKLGRDRAGQYAVRINKQWRVCFRWRAGHAYDVEVTKHYDD